jgi:hypothetical protein
LKIGLIALGYVAAVLIACGVVAIHVATTSGPDAQASSGMYAFGDALLFIAVFGVCSLVPTGAALFFLRPYRRFWTVLAVVVLAVAVTGVTAAALFAIGRHATSSPLATLAMASVLRILVAPLLALAFLVFAAFSPYRAPRFALLAASGAEVAVSAYGGLVWVAPLLLHGV